MPDVLSYEGEEEEVREEVDIEIDEEINEDKESTAIDNKHIAEDKPIYPSS